LSGCDEQNGAISDEMVPLQVYAEVEDMVGETRATEKTAWANGDAIGVTCTTNSSIANNVKFTYSSSTGKWTPEKGVYFTSTSSVSFVAYYPYVNSTASYQTSDNDWLFAAATSASSSSTTASFTFKHKMSKLTVKLSGFSSTTCTVSGLKNYGRFYTLTGEVSNATSISSDRTFTSGTAVVIPPQTGTTNICITVEESSYTYSTIVSISGGIKSGYSYVYTMVKP
jgi:hypothetical protein